jgi:hypothetical protein
VGKKGTRKVVESKQDKEKGFEEKKKNITSNVSE